MYERKDNTVFLPSLATFWSDSYYWLNWSIENRNLDFNLKLFSYTEMILGIIRRYQLVLKKAELDYISPFADVSGATISIK